jgi:hypothetical protein
MVGNKEFIYKIDQRRVVFTSNKDGKEYMHIEDRDEKLWSFNPKLGGGGKYKTSKLCEPGYSAMSYTMEGARKLIREYRKCLNSLFSGD